MPKQGLNTTESTAVAPAQLSAPESWNGGEAGLQHDSSLTFYWSLVQRFRGRIVAFVLFVTAAATLVALVLPKQYSATATLRIDPASGRTVGEQSSTDNNVSINAQDLMNTEADMVASPAVVQQMIDDLHLDRNPEFAPRSAAAGAPLSLAGANQVVRAVTKAIAVSQPLNSYLLSVSFRSRDPQLSADAANELLKALIQHDYQTRMTALTGASDSMQSQLTDLRAKMEKAQQALVEYESTHDVLDPDSNTNIMQARLTQVNQDLGKAENARTALQAEYAIARGGDLDALLASDRGQPLELLYQRLLEDRFKLAQMAQMYGPNFPVFRQQEGLVQNDRTVLQEQEQHVANQIASEYQAALAKERLLAGELSQQKQSMDAFNLKAIRYYALKASSDAYSKLYYQLQQSVQDATVAASLHSENLRVVSTAVPSMTPVFPRPLLTAGLSFILALGLGIGIAIAHGVLDRTLSSPDQIEHLFKLPVVAALPQVGGRDARQLIAAGYGPKLLGAGNEVGTHAGSPDSSPFREAVLGLHNAVMLTRNSDLHVLAVTSSVPAEGKTTLAANLAAAFAASGGSTVLVDTDMRKPGAHRQFQLQNRRGLSALLRGQCLLDQVLMQIPEAPNFMLLPAGSMPSSPAQLLHLHLEDLLDQLRPRFEHIIVDCPPVLGFADALTPANLADACILVVRAGATDRQMVSAALRQLRSARAEMLGAVLNSVSQKQGAYYSYYSHYYQYHNSMPDNMEEENDD